MATTNNRQPQAVFFKITFPFSNLPTIVQMEMKLCACVFHCFHDNRQQKCPHTLFPITTSSLLKLANHAMHGGKLGTHVYFSVSMTSTDKKLPQALFPVTTSSLLKLANHAMHGGKLGTHVYFSVSMTSTDKKLPQALFPITTSSLLKLAHHTMNGGETWYTCVFQRISAFP